MSNVMPVYYKDWSTVFKYKEKSGFYVEAASPSYFIDGTVVTRSDKVKELLGGAIFWEYNILDYSETHKDAAIPHKSFANAASVQTMGAYPIQVTAEGWVYTTVKEDHRLDFLTYYNEVIRGSIAHEQDVFISFFMKNTYMHICLQGISVSNTTDNEDMTHVGFSGLGYKYQCI